MLQEESAGTVTKNRITGEIHRKPATRGAAKEGLKSRKQTPIKSKNERQNQTMCKILSHKCRMFFREEKMLLLLAF